MVFPRCGAAIPRGAPTPLCPRPRSEPLTPAGGPPPWKLLLVAPPNCPPTPVPPASREIDGSDGTLGSDEADVAPTDMTELTRERIFDFSASPGLISFTTAWILAASATLRAFDRKAK